MVIECCKSPLGTYGWNFQITVKWIPQAETDPRISFQFQKLCKPLARVSVQVTTIIFKESLCSDLRWVIEGNHASEFLTKGFAYRGQLLS